MFDFSRVEWAVPTDIAPLFTETLEDVASAGNAWTGAEKVALVNVARNGPHADGSDLLPDAALDAAVLISTRPRVPDESWVRATVSAIGETHYVELVAVTAAVSAVDTVTSLLGLGKQALPEARPGDPEKPPHDPQLKRRSGWVSMTGPSNPKHALSAAPKGQATVIRLLERLYMSVDERKIGGPIRGLSAEQRELVALKVSLTNECFW